MKNKIYIFLFSLTVGAGFFSCQKQEDPRPENTPQVPFRIAKTTNTAGAANGYTSYTITTSEGYTYTMTFQVTNGYTTILVTQPGGTNPQAGACIDKIVAFLEKWINAQSTLPFESDACTITRTFVSDLRTLKTCVPDEAKADFEDAVDEIENAVDNYCE